MEKPKIVVADDNSRVRKEFIDFLNLQNKFQVVGEASNGISAIQLADELKPDVILLDVVMPVMNGLDAAKELSEKHPNMKIILLTNYFVAEYITIAAKNGASGYFVKNYLYSELVNAIDTVLNGGEYFENVSSTEILIQKNPSSFQVNCYM